MIRDKVAMDEEGVGGVPMTIVEATLLGGVLERVEGMRIEEVSDATGEPKEPLIWPRLM